MRKEKKGVFASVYIVGLLAFLYIPILIMIAYSFNSSEISSIWGGFSTEWYKVLFSRHDVRNALLNTLEVSVPATVISIVLATVGVIGFYKSACGSSAAASRHCTFVTLQYPWDKAWNNDDNHCPYHVLYAVCVHNYQGCDGRL